MRCRRTCEKAKMSYRKGLWSPEEDQKLKNYILQYGHGCWSSIPPKAGLQRNGKSCRLRWINYLRPGLKRGIFTPEEERIVMSLHAKLGNKWSRIAMHLPGRTDNEIKNYWNSYLKKKVLDHSESGDPNDSLKEVQNVINQNTKPESFHMREMSNKISLSPVGVDDGSFKSTFPKVLFAEWLSSDEMGGGPGGGFDDISFFEDQMQSFNVLIGDMDMSCDFMHGLNL